MARFLRGTDKRIGAVPGSLVFIGEHRMDQTRIRRIAYTSETMEETEHTSIADLPAPDGGVTWINVDGLHDATVLHQIGDRFGIHSLILEDVLNTGQRPAFVDGGQVLFLVVKMLRFDQEEKKGIIAEQLSVLLGDRWVITFQERVGDVFEPVRERLRNRQGRIRTWGSDYLAYALLDTVVDQYIAVVERLGERVEDLEEEILTGANHEVLEKITTYKCEMNYLRKMIRPAREAIQLFARADSDLIEDQTSPFLRDLQDIATQAAEAVDTYRDMLTDQLNTYRTAVGTNLNEIMKVLTIFAAIFIPLTFIVGVYGTNFDNVPEFRYKYGYYVLWGVLLTVGGVMLRYFHKKGWL